MRWTSRMPKWAWRSDPAGVTVLVVIVLVLLIAWIGAVGHLLLADPCCPL